MNWKWQQFGNSWFSLGTAQGSQSYYQKVKIMREVCLFLFLKHILPGLHSSTPAGFPLIWELIFSLLACISFSDQSLHNEIALLYFFFKYSVIYFYDFKYPSCASTSLICLQFCSVPWASDSGITILLDTSLLFSVWHLKPSWDKTGPFILLTEPVLFFPQPQ